MEIGGLCQDGRWMSWQQLALMEKHGFGPGKKSTHTSSICV